MTAWLCLHAGYRLIIVSTPGDEHFDGAAIPFGDLVKVEEGLPDLGRRSGDGGGATDEDTVEGCGYLRSVHEACSEKMGGVQMNSWRVSYAFDGLFFMNCSVRTSDDAAGSRVSC